MPGRRLIRADISEYLRRVREIAAHGPELTVEEVRELIQLMKAIFDLSLVDAGHDVRAIRALTTKFRDAGRRSAPWRPTSSRVPGRPQDGADGNRISRWLLPPDHKFFADEVTATLVEVKYYVEAFSMDGAPVLPELQGCFDWLVDHDVAPGNYRDPLQGTVMSLQNFLADPRSVESGHYEPLDRGGRHVSGNCFLMLAQSNKLQGNLTFDELLDLMARIVEQHGR